MMTRSLVALCATALLDNHVVQGYRVNNKKLMTSTEGALAKRPPAPNVLHSVGVAQSLNESDSEQTTKDDESTPAVETSAPSALVDQAANKSADVETKEWEPQGLLVKIGYLRSAAILHVASWFLPASMMQKMPVMDGMKVFDVPVAEERPFFGLPFDSTEGKIVYGVVIAGVVATLGFMVKFYSSIVAAKAKLAAEGDDDDVASALKEIAGLAIPMLLAAIFAMINEMANTIILGQRGSAVELASLGLVQSLYNCGIMTVGSGIQMVMDTVVSQAFGAGDQALCLAYMQRCRFLCLILLVVVLPLFWFSEPILVLFGQEVDVALRTATPARLFWIGGSFFQMTSASFIFLKNVGDLSMIWVFAASNVVHLSSAFFFAIHMDWGITGIATAMVFQSGFVTSCIQYHLVNKSIVKDAPLVQKLGFTVESLDGIWDYIALAIPAALSSACESWFWEINTMIIGWLGAVNLAAQSSTQSMVATLMIICASTAGSGTTLVARALGSGHPRRSRMISFIGIVTITLMWGVCAVFLFVTDRPLARVFNSNPKVLNLMYTLLHISAATGFMTCAQLIAGSVLKAMLKHRLVATIQFFNYYIIALPLGYYLAFSAGHGIFGIYNGLMVAMMLSSLTLIGVASTMDFDVLTMQTKARLEQDSKNPAEKPTKQG